MFKLKLKIFINNILKKKMFNKKNSFFLIYLFIVNLLKAR